MQRNALYLLKQYTVRIDIAGCRPPGSSVPFRKTEFNSYGVMILLVRCVKYERMTDFPVVKVAQFRVFFEFQKNIIQTMRIDIDHICLILRRRISQSVVDAIGKKGYLTSALFRNQPCIAHLLPVNQDAPEIIDRQGIDTQNLACSKEGLKFFRLPRRICENILDIPSSPITKIGDGVTERFEHRDAGVVTVVVRPPAACGLLNVFNTLATQEVIVCAMLKIRLFWYGDRRCCHCYACRLYVIKGFVDSHMPHAEPLFPIPQSD